MTVVDLDAFDANAADLTRRAAGKPVRVASKSLRIPALVERALATPGFAGVLSYSLREALWLVREGITNDAVMGYPSSIGSPWPTCSPTRRPAAGHPDGRRPRPPVPDRVGRADGVRPRVAIDIDAGLKLGRSHVGPKRSPLYDASQVVDLAREAIDRGFSPVGVMTYEGQVAGVPDDVPHQRAKSLVVPKLKSASIAQLEERRAQIAEELRDVVDLGSGTPGVPAASSRPSATRS